nr:hypothetical protein [Lachnospiraceae bacterium]
EQYEKNAAFLKHQKDIADEDASRARKDGIKSAVYGIANDAAKGAKSFMDRLTVGVAEAVVKGRTRQLEDDLAEKEREYQLKGKTILAKNRQALRHTKNAGRYAEHSEQWELEMRQAAEMSGEAEKLTKERGEIGGEIRDLREKLAEARVREKKELAELDDKLHRAYGMDQEAVQEAHTKAQIRTDVNALKGIAAMLKVSSNTAPFEDLITSAAYTEVDSEQRQLMEAEAKQFKQELAADEKGRQLMEISDQLKGLFTPKNLSRVDTMVNAAENLYKLYGKVRELTDGGDGDEAGEDEKDLTASVKEMKDKVSEIREKMMGDGEDTTEVVDAVLALADNMRAVTDQISGKIEAASKEAEAKWIESREISRESQRDYEVFSDGFRDHMERTVAEVVTPHMEEKLLDARIRMQERIDLAEDVVEQAQVDVNDARADLDKKKAALKKAEDILARAEKSQIEMEERRKRAEAEIAAEEARKAAEEAKKAAEAKKLNEEKASDTAKGSDDAQIFEGSKEPDPRLEQLQDILDNLQDTGRGYFGHSNSKEYNDVVEKLTDYLADGRTSVDPSDPATVWLTGALAAYLDHTGMDTAWHKSGNIRKENILAALNLVDHDTALTYEAKANKVRNSRSKISLDTLMDSEHIKRREPRPTRDRTRSASGPKLSGMDDPELSGNSLTTH